MSDEEMMLHRSVANPGHRQALPMMCMVTSSVDIICVAVEQR